MKRVLVSIMALIALLVLTFAALHVSGMLDRLLPAEPLSQAGFETLTKPASPNSYLVCPDDGCSAEPDRRSPRFDAAPAKLIDRLIEIARADGATEIERTDDLAVEMVVRTPIVRWPDRVSARAFASDGASDRAGSTIAVFSRSKYGRSDLGANKARVDRWLERLAE